MAKQYILENGYILQNRYRIESVLGEGGFGITYKAHDVFMDIPVAIKEYNHKKMSGYEEAVKEAKIAAGFYELESIASARDFFTENDLAYIVMEFVNGISVKKYIRANGSLEARSVLEKVRPLMKSLIKIHEAGVIHRDISSDNIMITKDNRFVLIDFGAARFMKEYENRDYTVIVKRGFSPIEQCHAGGDQGPYTDVYSLCATIYYMITGIVPNDSVERVVNDRVKPLGEVEDTGLSSSECDVIMKGMSIWSKDRYSSVKELYCDLYNEQDVPENDIVMPQTGSDAPYTVRSRHGSTTSLYNAVKYFYKKKSRAKYKAGAALLFMCVAAVIIVLCYPSPDVSDADMKDGDNLHKSAGAFDSAKESVYTGMGNATYEPDRAGTGNATYEPDRAGAGNATDEPDGAGTGNVTDEPDGIGTGNATDESDSVVSGRDTDNATATSEPAEKPGKVRKPSPSRKPADSGDTSGKSGTGVDDSGRPAKSDKDNDVHYSGDLDDVL